MKIKVLVFGQLCDITKFSEMDIMDVPDTDALKLKLNSLFPAMNEAKFRIAVNKTIIQEKTLLAEGDTIALMPPFSGG